MEIRGQAGLTREQDRQLEEDQEIAMSTFRDTTRAVFLPTRVSADDESGSRGSSPPMYQSTGCHTRPDGQYDKCSACLTVVAVMLTTALVLSAVGVILSAREHYNIALYQNCTKAINWTHSTNPENLTRVVRSPRGEQISTADLTPLLRTKIRPREATRRPRHTASYRTIDTPQREVLGKGEMS